MGTAIAERRPNLALREARRRAHLSQDDLARLIREAGFRRGDSTACTRAMVQRWESGRVRRPQGRYLIALESVLGAPASSLGFADVAVGMDRERALAEAGLDAELVLPEPGANYGPLTGIWLSEYEYPSTGREGVYTGRHYVLLLQRGAHLLVRSLPRSFSRLSIEMDVNGQVATGTWTEQTAEGGYYRGAVYHGAIQMLGEPTGHRMAGMWVGFGRDLAVNTGPWKLELITESVDPLAMDQFSRAAEGATQ
jgi:transcriptional regulator with XRE-family HTH domain